MPSDLFPSQMSSCTVPASSRSKCIAPLSRQEITERDRAPRGPEVWQLDCCLCRLCFSAKSFTLPHPCGSEPLCHFQSLCLEKTSPILWSCVPLGRNPPKLADRWLSALPEPAGRRAHLVLSHLVCCGVPLAPSLPCWIRSSSIPSL